MWGARPRVFILVGVLEYWSDGVMGFRDYRGKKNPDTPIFQYSTTPIL